MDLIKGLERIGFLESESRVYLLLLEHNPASGYQLGKAAGLPRSMVYDALSRLEARAAVLRTEKENTVLYRPLEPDKLLARHLEDQQATVESLIPGLKERYRSKPDENIWSFRDRAEALLFARDMIAGARQELLMVLTDPDLDSLGEDIQVTAKRIPASRLGILLTGQGEFDHGSVARHPIEETLHHKMEETLILVRDNEEVLISRGLENTNATLTRNQNLVFISRHYVWMELFTRRMEARLSPEERAELRMEI